ncbi:retrovirus-related Pol polyprotein from transposon 17.6 [Trichonephila clavipes]|nr:retrovirus-related Pol polyprotein from transposon 17.6 [Trichonephila clavipes]
MAGGNLRLLHVNKIREYRARVKTVGVVYDIDDEFGEIYETPTVPAAEKNDEALDRVTLDYLSKKSLNALTVPDAYPMQNMMELNFLVGKKKFITVLDMLKGYWSIPMEDNSKHLTAFRTHRGQYQWNVLPFGLRNAAAT